MPNSKYLYKESNKMRIQLLILLCFFQQFSISQTIIKLNSPKTNQEEYSCTNPSDSLFVTFGHREDMGVWYGSFYKMKMNVHDGEYLFYVDDTLELKAFIKDSHKNGIWTYYFRNGKVKQISQYKGGELEGYKTRHYPNGTISSRTKYVNGKDEYTIEYYESGYVHTKSTTMGEELKTEEFSDSINIIKPNNNKIKSGTYKVISAKCADLVINEDGTCHFKSTSNKKKIAGVWKVSHGILFLSFDAYRIKSPVESFVSKNGKPVKKVRYTMSINYKIEDGALIPKDKSSQNLNYNCGVYILQKD